MLEDNPVSYPPLTEPNKTDPFYKVMEPQWHKLETVMAGSQALRDAGVKYTPKFVGEDDEAYKARLQKTDLTNVLSDSVDNATAKPFSKEFVLDPDPTKTNPKFLEWAEDVDMEGNNLNDFGKEAFEHGMTYGWSYLLVDYPNTQGRELTKQDVEEEGIRPYVMFLTAQSVISYRTAKVAGHKKPVYIRYQTFDHEFKPDGDAIEIRRVHEIRAGVIGGEPGYYRNYESRDKNEWEVVSEGHYPFDALTCVRFETGKRRGKDGATTPLFMDLCEKNIAHWNSASDQANIMTRTRFAIYHFKGLDLPRDPGTNEPLNVVLGPDTILTSPADGNSEVQTVTLPTDGIQQGWVDQDRKEADMRIMGLDPNSADTSGTATGRQLDDKKSNSLLEGLALSFKDAIEQSFLFMGVWAGFGEGQNIVKANINTRFGVTNKEINEIKMFQDMQSMGQLSLETLLEEAKRRQMFNPDFDVEEEVSKIGDESSDTYGYDLEDELPNPKKVKQAAKESEMKDKTDIPEAA